MWVNVFCYALAIGVGFVLGVLWMLIKLLSWHVPKIEGVEERRAAWNYNV